jgi:hypothetical protein
MNMDLKPFSTNSGCKMCRWSPARAGEPAESRFCVGELIKAKDLSGNSLGDWNDCLMKNITAPGGITPHIHRTCPRCGYEWIEGVLKGENDEG